MRCLGDSLYVMSSLPLRRAASLTVAMVRAFGDVELDILIGAQHSAVTGVMFVGRRTLGSCAQLDLLYLGCRVFLSDLS